MAWILAWETDGFVFIESVKGNSESFGVSDSSAAFLWQKNNSKKGNFSPTLPVRV